MLSGIPINQACLEKHNTKKNSSEHNRNHKMPCFHVEIQRCERSLFRPALPKKKFAKVYTVYISKILMYSPAPQQKSDSPLEPAPVKKGNMIFSSEVRSYKDLCARWLGVVGDGMGPEPIVMNGVTWVAPMNGRNYNG